MSQLCGLSKRTIACGVALGWLVLVPLQATAAEDLTLNKAVAEIAKAVADVVKAQSGKEVVVGLFNDNDNPNHTFGVGLRKLLIEQLRGAGLEPVSSAEIVVKGEYALGPAVIEGQEQDFPVAKIAFKVARRNGKLLLDSEKDLEEDRRPRVSDRGDLAKMGGATVFQPPTASPAENHKKFFDSEDGKPTTFEREGTKVRPTGAPFAVEMLVARITRGQRPRHDEFQPRAVEVRDGRPFLKVQPGEAVAVRIINDASHDVASTITLDGLSLFAFRDDKADKGEHVVVRAHQAGDVLGWFRNERTSDVFLVSDLAPDLPDAKLLKNPAEIGSITVTFAAAWESDPQRPKDEPGSRQATELRPGPPIDAPYQKVKRFIGVFRAAVTVRYDKQ